MAQQYTEHKNTFMQTSDQCFLFKLSFVFRGKDIEKTILVMDFCRYTYNAYIPVIFIRKIEQRDQFSLSTLQIM